MTRTRFPPAAVATIAAVSALGLVLPLLVPLSPRPFLIAASLAVCVVPVIAVLYGRAWDPFEPSVWFMVSYAVLFVIRPIGELILGGAVEIAGHDPTPTYDLALTLAIVGGMAVYAGYYLGPGERVGRAIPALRQEMSAARVGVIAAVVCGIGLGLFALFVFSSGGLPALFAILAGRNETSLRLLSQPLGYLYSGPLFLIGVAILQLAVIGRWRSIGAVLALVVLALGLIVALSTGARSWTLAALSAVYVLYYLRRQSRPSTRALAALLVIVFFAGITASRDFRDTAVRRGSYFDALVSAVTSPERAIEDFVLGLDTSMLGTFAIELQHVPEVTPYRLGSTYLAALTRPVPRALWPQKPREGDVDLMQVVWPQLARYNVLFTFSLFGEPYFNFGAFGVPLMGFIFGLGFRGLYAWFRAGAESRLVQAVFAVSLPMVYVYVRGGVGVDYHRHMILLVPILVAGWFAGVGPRRRESPASRGGVGEGPRPALAEGR